IEANDGATTGGIPEAIALDDRRGGNAHVGEIVYLTGWQLVVDVLPKELAGGFVEAHQHALVERGGFLGSGIDSQRIHIARISRRSVVRADEDFAAEDYRLAI